MVRFTRRLDSAVSVNHGAARQPASSLWKYKSEIRSIQFKQIVNANDINIKEMFVLSISFIR